MNLHCGTENTLRTTSKINRRRKNSHLIKGTDQRTALVIKSGTYQFCNVIIASHHLWQVHGAQWTYIVLWNIKVHHAAIHLQRFIMQCDGEENKICPNKVRLQVINRILIFTVYQDNCIFNMHLRDNLDLLEKRFMYTRNMELW